MSWKEIIEGKIDTKMSDALQKKQEVVSERTVEEENEYQKFFQSALKKFGVKSPAEMDDAKKKKFFDYIDANWEGDNEKAEGTEAQDSIKPSKKKDLAASNCGS
jgi:hypothetical protein